MNCGEGKNSRKCFQSFQALPFDPIWTWETWPEANAFIADVILMLAPCKQEVQGRRGKNHRQTNIHKKKSKEKE